MSLFLQKLYNDQLSYDSYLKLFKRDPRDYSTLNEKFVELAKCSKESGRLTENEIKLIEHPFFVESLDTSTSLLEVSLKCLNYVEPSPKEDIVSVGFKFLAELTKHLESNCTTYLTGGAAGYLHILNREGVKINLNDIDFNIVSDQYDERIIHEKMLDFTSDFCIRNNLGFRYNDLSEHEGGVGIGYLYLVNRDNEEVELNFFLNQFTLKEITENHDADTTIFGIRTGSFEKIFEYESMMLQEAKDIIEANYDEDETKIFVGKAARKQEIVDHMSKLI